MVRKAGATKELAIEVVEKNMQYFKTNDLPVYTSDVWISMSEDIKSRGGTWTAHDVYTAVRENRRKILSTARQNQNIILDAPSEKSFNDSSVLDNSVPEPEDEDYEINAEAAGLATFHLLITRLNWKGMRESLECETEGVNRAGLQKDVWEHVLSNIIRIQTDLPCVYVFKEVNISNSTDSSHYLRIKGHCKSKKCKNPMFAYVNANPGDADFILTLRTNDTRKDKQHEVVYRPLRGIVRDTTAQEVFHEGAYNWRNQRIKGTELGKRINPTVSPLHVLNQCKLEHRNRLLDSAPGDGDDVRVTILRMQDDPKYSNSILDVSSSPFSVVVSSPAQRFVYKRYHEMNKQRTVVSGDGTGSTSTTFMRGDRTRSGHIFLYSLVIHVDGVILPIHEMLSESQHTIALERWLRLFITPPAPLPKLPKPAQFVCDRSRALMNAACLAFNDQLITAYVNTCFLFAMGKDEFRYRPLVSTHIRNDVAHLMNLIATWDCLTKIQWEQVRAFYLYCVALMVDCQNIEEFEEIFLLTCTVGLHSNQSEKIMALPGKMVIDARQTLERKIAHRPRPDILQYAKKTSKQTDKSLAESETPEESHDPNYRSHIKEWIGGIVEKAQTVEMAATSLDINAFEAPEFIKSLVNLCYEFPLWTAVGIPFVTGRASSACSEGYFRIWKKIACQNLPKNLRIDKHIKHQLNNQVPGLVVEFDSKLSELNNQAKLLKSPVRKNPRENAEESTQSENHSDDERVYQNGSQIHLEDSPEDSDCSLDNWRNKGIERTRKRVRFESQIIDSNTKSSTAANRDEVPKKKKGKYFKSFPEIEQQNKLLKSIMPGWLLRNGGGCNPVYIDGEAHFVVQTCHYDALLQILISMAFDDDDFKKLIKQEENDTLKLVVKLVEQGPTPENINTRGMILGGLFKSRRLIKTRTRSRILTYEIDTMNPPMETWASCLPHDASRTLLYNCHKCGQYRQQQNSIQVNSNLIINDDSGFGVLESALLYAHGEYMVHCTLCKEVCLMSVIPNYYVCVELDIREDLEVEKGKECCLHNIPTELEPGSTYRLAGVVGYTRDPRHCIAYCKRADLHWEIHNDCDQKIRQCGSSLKIEPHLAIYVRQDLKNYSPGGEFPSTFKMNIDESIPESTENPTVQPCVHTDEDMPDLVLRDEPIVESSRVNDNFDDHVEVSSVNENMDTEANEKNDTTDSRHSDCEAGGSVLHSSGIVDGTNAKEVESIRPPTISLVFLRGKYYSISNASTFDCLIRLICSAAQSNIAYRKCLESSQNLMFKLVLNLVQNGVTEAFCRARAICLVNNFPLSIHPDRRYGRVSRRISVNGPPYQAWTACFDDEPSMGESYECSKCGSYLKAVSFLEPNKDKLIRQQYKKLQEALDSYDKLYKVKCKNDNCSGTCTVDFMYNFHVYVKLLFTDRQLMHTRCKLQDLAVQLVLSSNRYKLIGVNAYHQGAYVTYVKGTDETWNVFGGAYSSAKESSGTKEIVPAGALYVVEANE